MEGSAYSRNVANYVLLSKFYDDLLQDRDSLDLWLNYLLKDNFSSCLELGSGSAVITGIIKDKGYNIVASDISDDMKEVAKKNFDGEYLKINMIDFDIDRKFDLIFTIVDSINYLEEDELDSCFKSVYRHLNDGGRFIFDMHHKKRLDEFEEEYIEEGYVNDVPYQWSIASDKIERMINQHFTFYLQNGIIQEHHTQYVFDIDLVRNKLTNIGFEVEVIEDFVEDEKVLIVGYKR